MRPEVMEALTEWYPAYLEPGKHVLELGSREVYGGVPRSLFTGDHEYTGVDMLDGSGVDVVLNFHDLETHFPPTSVDTVLCLETLEHDAKFWLTLDQVRKVLKIGGLFVCSVPTISYTAYHPHPEDYYRFTHAAFREVLFPSSWCALKRVRHLYTAGVENGLLGIGRKRK